MVHRRNPLAALLGLAVLWWVIVGGEPGAWLVGLPAIALALAASGGAGVAARLSLPGLLRFLPLFLVESVRGGLDVVARTLAPRLRIRPGYASYRTVLERPVARSLFVLCIGLLPGTLVAGMQGRVLEVHLLNRDADVQAELARLERALGRLLCDPGVRA